MTNQNAIARPVAQPLVLQWLESLAHLEAQSFVVLGPQLGLMSDERGVVAAFPGAWIGPALSLATSGSFGIDAREALLGLADVVDLAKVPEVWAEKATAMGAKAMVRVEFPLPVEQAFECFAFFGMPIGTAQAHAVVWELMQRWPALRAAIVVGRYGVTSDEASILRVLSQGTSTRAAAAALSVTERSVTMNLATVMVKLKAATRGEAIHKAIALGII